MSTRALSGAGVRLWRPKKDPNGQSLSAVSNPQQFMDNLAGAGNLSVTVLRDGKPATLTVSLH